MADTTPTSETETTETETQAAPETPEVPNFLEMSDEEFAKLPPPGTEIVVKPAAEPPAEEEVPAGDVGAQVEDKPEETAPLADPANKGPDVFKETKDPKAPAEKKDADKKPEPAATQEVQPKSGGKKPVVEEKPAKAPKIDSAEHAKYKGFYEQILGTPIKAAGKEIKLQSAEEVIQLLQMGADYTRKTQAMQPQKKLLLMLENNGLLDEGKLSFLIDLDKRNPEAIKKLLADAKIDPVDLDVSKVNYQARSHAVTDQEAALSNQIDELNSTDGGRETLQSVNGWDPASKKALWEDPSILKMIHAQRVNGIFGKITGEMERRRVLGQIPVGVPFLQAYRIIGDEMNAKGAFNSVPQNAAPAPKPGMTTPVAVRPASTAAPKPGDTRVRAAAPPRTAAPGRAPAAPVNFLAMSDEDFLKAPPPR